MQRFVSLTNIPTPYRIHFYNALSPRLATHGIQLEVYFMADTEPGRCWALQRDEWKFRYRFAPGFHPMLSQRIFHLNPQYIWDLLVRPPSWLLMAGSWFLPTVVLSALGGKLTSTKTLFWSESNLAYVQHTGELAVQTRRLVMNRFDGFVVPGKEAQQYVLTYAPAAKSKPFLLLPNVVDELKFGDEVERRREQKSTLLNQWNLTTKKQPILLAVARLELIKGMRELIQALCRSDLYQRVTLIVAGDGSLRPELEKIITQAEADRNILLLGHLGESQVLDLMALADALILPSLGDAYPLAAIEAAFAKLPLLLSNRVGSIPEILIPGKNGFSFDPTTPSDIESAVKQFLEVGPFGWAKMGAASSQLAAERFATDKVLSQFTDEVIRL